jgi:hypothetical protein
MEAGGGIEPPMGDLQSPALPLCYPAANLLLPLENSTHCVKPPCVPAFRFCSTLLGRPTLVLGWGSRCQAAITAPFGDPGDPGRERDSPALLILAALEKKLLAHLERQELAPIVLQRAGVHRPLKPVVDARLDAGDLASNLLRSASGGIPVPHYGSPLGVSPAQPRPLAPRASSACSRGADQFFVTVAARLYQRPSEVLLPTPRPV